MFIRRDIPIADQIVQASHATLEAGRRFDWEDHTHMVILGINNEEELLQALERTREHGIEYELFFEPDDNMGYTAACTEPISGKDRNVFRKYNLWRSIN